MTETSDNYSTQFINKTMHSYINHSLNRDYHTNLCCVFKLFKYVYLSNDIYIQVEELNSLSIKTMLNRCLRLYNFAKQINSEVIFNFLMSPS